MSSSTDATLRSWASASASACDRSRSAQATSSNESKAFAPSAYWRLITPQPTTPTRAGVFMRPRPRPSPSAPRTTGGPRPAAARPSRPARRAATRRPPRPLRARRVRSRPAPSPTGANEPGSRLEKSFTCTSGHRPRARSRRESGSAPAYQAQPRSSSRKSAFVASDRPGSSRRRHAASPRRRGCGSRARAPAPPRRPLRPSGGPPGPGRARRVDPADGQPPPAERPRLRGQGRQLRLDRLEDA